MRLYEFHYWPKPQLWAPPLRCRSHCRWPQERAKVLQQKGNARHRECSDYLGLYIATKSLTCQMLPRLADEKLRRLGYLFIY